MTSKTIFNMDAVLKRAAMKKAKKEGWTLSAFLNFATREYVAGSIKMTALQRDIAASRERIRKGRFITQEELFKKLGI